MIRLRLSMTNEQWTLFEDAGKVLGLDPKVVLQMSAAIGLRFLDMSLIHPINAVISKAVDETAAQNVAALGTDLTKIMGQVPPKPAEKTSQPRQNVSGKRVSRKGK